MCVLLMRHARRSALGWIAFLCFAAGCSHGESSEKTSLWPDGTLKERWVIVTVDDGAAVRHGVYESWHESGRPYEKGRYEHGLRIGVWSSWYDHEPIAVLSRGEYRSGKPHGRWMYWHNPSHLTMASNPSKDPISRTDASSLDPPILKVANYIRGVAHGDWISWHPSGRVADSMRYVQGKLEGVVVVYDTAGHVVSRRAFKNGRLINGGQAS